MGNTEKTELTVMCMICDGTKILVQDRVNKDWPGVTFPGGHVEPGEAFTDAVRREVKEETGLDISRPTVCGIKDFIRDDGTRYIVLFFRADRFSGELKDSDEGRVFWIERDELTLIARLFTERFGKALLVDEHSLQKLEEDFATVQSELLDQMLDQVQRREFRFRMHMVGLRENDRVVVYNR